MTKNGSVPRTRSDKATPAGPSNFGEVVASRVYTPGEVAGLLRVTPRTIRNWVDDGRLPRLPKLSERGPIRILGSAVLALLGEQARSLPGPSETKAERNKRADAAMDDVRAMKGKPAGRK